MGLSIDGIFLSCMFVSVERKEVGRGAEKMSRDLRDHEHGMCGDVA